MPRKAKAKTNGRKKKLIEDDAEILNFENDKVERFVARVENVDKKIDAIHAKATKEAQPFADDRKEIIKEAAESGIPKAEFRAILRKRKLQRRAEQVRDSLNESQQDNFDRLELALGQLDMFETARPAQETALAAQ